MLSILLGLFLLIGCGSKHSASKAKPSATPPDEPMSREVITNGATFTRSGYVLGKNKKPLVDAAGPTKLERAYDVRCRSSDLHYDDASKNYWGDMEGVSGTFYDKDEPVATYSADSGQADKATNLLRLRGHVHLVTVPKPKETETTLTCDNLEWHSDQRIVKAFIRVTVRGSKGTIGPMDEVWGSPTLNLIATPDLFSKP